MRLPTRPFLAALAALAGAMVLPMRSDGDAALQQCCNASTSLASTRNEFVNGDEAFFKLPSGPANVVFLLDVSGSMRNLPQCGDPGWTPDCGKGAGLSSSAACFSSGGSVATCTSPAIAAPALAGAATQAVAGTCTPSTYTANLAWMEAVVPKIGYADPGRSNALPLTDKTAWGTGCSGDGCLFDPDAYYLVDETAVSASPFIASQKRHAHDTDGTFKAKGCTLIDGTDKPIKDKNGVVVDLGDACRTCMATKGFYFYTAKYVDAASVTQTIGTSLQVRGTWLNANPPKFIAARKAIKDVAWMDPAAPTNLDQVRMGLTILDTTSSSGTNPTRAQLIIPLGPDKTTAYPPSQVGFRQARQYLFSVLNGDKSVYSAGATTIVNGATLTGFFNPVATSTPLASALFNSGQYFANVGLWTSLFGNITAGTPYELAALKETSAGNANAPWAGAGLQPCSICWACQNNAIIIVTDGAPNTEMNLPASLLSYDTVAYTKAANCGAGGALCAAASPLPRVASWLHNNDLRADFSLPGGKPQTLTVHTIGLGIVAATNIQLLKATANMGGGMYQNVTDSSSLAAAVYNAVNQVVPRENSFSAASANSLQTVQTASSEAFLTRFKPNSQQTWEGHLFQAALFDEFLNGCDPSKPNGAQPQVSCGGKMVSANFDGNTDSSGNAICTGVFLIDQDCDIIVEDATSGDFMKKGVGTAANFPWDAGAVLSDPGKTGYRSADEAAANARNIFTYVPDATGNLVKVPFTTANVATLKPFFSIPAAWCTNLLTLIGIAGGADPTTVCANQIIHFVRGWDVLDQDSDNCWGPGNPKNTAACKSGTSGEERDRTNDGRASPTLYKLGDIFHSSPAVVQPPIDEIRCDTGYEKQCVATLHSPGALPNQTKISTAYTNASGGTVDAYERYRLDHLLRKRVVLAGANDGMLHAFDAGNADTTKTPDPTGLYPYTPGSGQELWAFIPPDLLPRLKDLLNSHQYMVDGSVMVRDVWTDANADRVKTKDEFHTVAIFGERSGGNQYSALDVTDPVNPSLLWTFPKPCSEDERYMGQSWSDFAPRPPPIGPVKMASAADPRGFEERWIVMLNGGYDPALTRGRAVFMVDAWTGATVWRFTDDDFKAFSNNAAGASMFPVPAGVAMVDIGDPTTASSDMDGFFDTATWGDLGGNLWVARFFVPGTIGNSGRVNNWFAARAFEEQRRADNLQGVAGRNEFYFMTSNAFEPTTRTLRTFLGSGNRERMMEQGASCGADNLMGCCRAGCTVVRATESDNYGACTDTTSFTCSAGVYSLPASSTTCGTGAAVCGSGGANFTSSTTLHFECPGAGVLADSVGTTTCTSAGSCSVTPVGNRTIAGTFSAPPKNRFYGLWSYGRVDRKMFATAAQAETFDASRFTDIAYSSTCTSGAAASCALVDTTAATVTYSGSSSTPTLEASADDPGWFYEYGRTCPLKDCSASPPPWADEKTGSGSTVVLGCAAWGGFRPFGVATTTDPCSGVLGTPVTYGYIANYVSGVPTVSCGYADSGVVYRAVPRSTTAPPSASTVRVTFSPTGQVAYSTLQVDAGSVPGSKTVGVRSEIGEPVYWLEVPRQLHQCRHVDPAMCN